MSATVVLGAQWGDEGKGKLTDILAQKVTLCCRAAGGNNAGHTIVVNGIKYDFHILPSGLVNPSCRNLIGSGCVVHIPSLFKELESLKAKGLDTTGRIFVSEAAHVVFDLHQRVDGLEEAALGKAKVGTTGKGIGPCYSTKMARSGIRIGELVYNKDKADQRLRQLADGFKARFGDLLQYDVEEEIKQCDALREQLKPMVVDAVTTITKAQAQGEQILIEGANALMLDIDYGTFPYVTSSSTGLGGCFTGLGGLKRKYIGTIVGVVKAYTTRVGSGPFPTEQLDENGAENEIGRKLQEIGVEFGATTGKSLLTLN
jgi:adenylosuccinate synthase